MMTVRSTGPARAGLWSRPADQVFTRLAAISDRLGAKKASDRRSPTPARPWHRVPRSRIEAAAIRLRPVLMTSLCTVFGAIPLLIASGAGAESRKSIGAVVVYGVMFSLLLTLYVVPVVYGYVARNTRSPEYIAHLIDKLRGEKKPQEAG